MFHSDKPIPNKQFRATARAIIIDDGKILLFERWRRDRLGRQLHYYSIPGGGIDTGETPEDAVVREMHEEMLVTVRPVRLLARQKAFKRRNYHNYFLCEIIEGTPTFNLDSEEGKYRHFMGNQYAVAWVPLDGLTDKIHHEEYRQLIEMLPELLSNTNRGTVDIVSEG
jgi:ADP-ribose pyrophosphatase YjhB (NUDIX family)